MLTLKAKAATEKRKTFETLHKILNQRYKSKRQEDLIATSPPDYNLFGCVEHGIVFALSKAVVALGKAKYGVALKKTLISADPGKHRDLAG